jgi:hypothetical protein
MPTTPTWTLCPSPRANGAPLLWPQEVGVADTRLLQPDRGWTSPLTPNIGHCALSWASPHLLLPLRVRPHGRRLYSNMPFRGCRGAGNAELASPVSTDFYRLVWPLRRGESLLMFVVFCEGATDFSSMYCNKLNDIFLRFRLIVEAQGLSPNERVRRLRFGRSQLCIGYYTFARVLNSTPDDECLLFLFKVQC